ncbi:MAG: hypothetical protein B5M53_05690 [Candidatus Cloacimonas sp. 4484_209]|nr:MAG: hypothetical protein B5M53_05690 [Candidatus Cloacimonas sp. 4484_209]
MIEIKEIYKGSIAEKIGLSTGDVLYSINGHRIRDSIDLMFYENDSHLEIELGKNNKRISLSIEKLPEENLGVELEPFRFRRCNNSCIFCFYDQMPKGLRSSLYERDDDYRLSFLYGNYITLTNMTENDFERIQEQQLSPLYISVHSTTPEIRAKLLGKRIKDVDIKKQLKRLSKADIKFHTQIVVCPGINDGKELEKTVFDLADFYPNILSIAIIPVGLTKYRNGLYPLRLLNKEESLDIVWKTLMWQELFRERFNLGFVYPSDEIFIKAEFGIPMKEFYDDFPQLENGVGISRIFLDGIEEIKTEELKGIKGRIVFVTSVLAYPWINLLRKRLMLESSLICDVIVVKNHFFGESVTVSGLLVGSDILDAIRNYNSTADLFMIPDRCINDDGFFIDGMSVEKLQDKLGRKIVVGPMRVNQIVKVIKKALSV